LALSGSRAGGTPSSQLLGNRAEQGDAFA